MSCEKLNGDTINFYFHHLRKNYATSEVTPFGFGNMYFYPSLECGDDAYRRYIGKNQCESMKTSWYQYTSPTKSTGFFWLSASSTFVFMFMIPLAAMLTCTKLSLTQLKTHSLERNTSCYLLRKASFFRKATGMKSAQSVQSK